MSEEVVGSVATQTEGALNGDVPTTTEPSVQTPGAQEGETPSAAQSESWLPEDLRGNERLQGFENPEALARAYLNAPPPQEIPETYTLPEGMSPKMGEWAKTNGFTQEQLDNVLKLQTDFQTYRQQTVNNVYAEGRKQLFNSWGDKKEENLRVAENVLNVVPSGQKLAQVLKQTGEGGNPLVIGFLHEIGGFLKEGGYLKGSTPKPETAQNPLKARYPTMFKDEE